MASTSAYIVEILKNSSQDNPLQQSKIVELLNERYHIETTRQTVSRLILDLQETYPIEQVPRKGYYLKTGISTAEFRLLTDSVLANSTISEKETKTLLEKIKGFVSKELASSCNSNLSNQFPKSAMEGVMERISIVAKAIKDRKAIEFNYVVLDCDKKVRQIKEKKFVVSPYEMVVNENKYYLIACENKTKTVQAYRLDRMLSIDLKNTEYIILNNVAGYSNDLDLKTFIPNFESERQDMKPITCHMKAYKSKMDVVYDAFGYQIETTSLGKQVMDVKCKAPYSSLRNFAINHLDIVEVIEPANLREDIIKTLQIGTYNYQNDDKNLY